MPKPAKLMAAALGLALISGCVGESVQKRERKVDLRPRAAKPMADRLKVAVAKFEEKAEYGRGKVGDAAADILATALLDSKQFRVYERQQLASVMDEQKLGQSGAVDPVTAARVGKLMGVDYVIYGAVTNAKVAVTGTDVILVQSKTLTAEVVVDVRMIKVEDGEIIFSETGRGDAKKTATGSLGLGGRMSYDPGLIGDALRAAIYEMMDAMIDKAENP
jgi:curli biogenesis system outer membrane secretion channel CsgG